MEPGYSHRDEVVSALAAKGSRAAKVMVPGFVSLAIGTVGFACSLRGSRVAPRPVPMLIGIAGLTTAGAGLARCSTRDCPSHLGGDDSATLADDLRAVAGLLTFALWVAIPLVAAARPKQVPDSYRTRSRVISATTFAALVAHIGLLKTPSRRWSGAAQRAMIASALAWQLLAGMTA
jgi:hypothetical protein